MNGNGHTAPASRESDDEASVVARGENSVGTSCDFDLLTKFAEGTLSRRFWATVLVHLRECPACDEHFALLRRFRGELTRISRRQILFWQRYPIAGSAFLYVAVFDHLVRHVWITYRPLDEEFVKELDDANPGLIATQFSREVNPTAEDILAYLRCERDELSIAAPPRLRKRLSGWREELVFSGGLDIPGGLWSSGPIHLRSEREHTRGGETPPPARGPRPTEEVGRVQLPLA